MAHAIARAGQERCATREAEEVGVVLDTDSTGTGVARPRRRGSTQRRRDMERLQSMRGAAVDGSPAPVDEKYFLTNYGGDPTLL